MDYHNLYFSICFSRIKKYSEKHSTLFAGICSVICTAIVTFLRVCYYSYFIGYYHYFNINFLTIPSAQNETILLTILFTIGLICIFILFNYIGYLFYSKKLKHFLLYLLSCIILFSFLIYVSLFKYINILNIQKTFLRVSLLAIYLTVMINLIIISYSIPDIIITAKNKFYKVTVDKSQHFFFANDLFMIKYLSITMLILMSLLIVGIYFIGLSNAKDITNFATVSYNQLSNRIPQNNNDSFAILYENDQYLILSPCVVSIEPTENYKSTLYIFTDKHFQTEKDNIVMEKKNYDEVKICNFD